MQQRGGGQINQGSLGGLSCPVNRTNTFSYSNNQSHLINSHNFNNLNNHVRVNPLSQTAYFNPMNSNIIYPYNEFIQENDISDTTNPNNNLSNLVQIAKPKKKNNTDVNKESKNKLSPDNLSVAKKKASDDTNNLLTFLNGINEELIDYVQTQKGSRYT